MSNKRYNEQMKLFSEWSDVISENMRSMLNPEAFEEEIAITLNDQSQKIVHTELMELMRYSNNVFGNQKCWAGLLFMAGWYPDETEKDDVATLAACVDSLQMSLILFAKIMFQPSFCENEELMGRMFSHCREAIQNDSTEIALRGILAGHADYLIFSGIMLLENNKTVKKNVEIKDYIMEWYLGCLIRIYQELLCISKGETQGKCISELNGIWKQDKPMSVFSLGKKCSGKFVEERDYNIKECEFWLMCQTMLKCGCFDGKWIDNNLVKNKIEKITKDLNLNYAYELIEVCKTIIERRGAESI